MLRTSIWVSCLSLAASAAASAAAAAGGTPCTTSTITVQAWPFSAPTPTPMAHILQTSCRPDPPTFSLLTWTPPLHYAAEVDHIHARYAHWDPLSAKVRVGHIDPKSLTPEQKFETWDGILTTAPAFTPGMKKTIILHLDRDENFVHVGFMGSHEQVPFGEQEVVVEVRPVQAGPKPFLNKPIVLDDSGKVQTEEKDERSFLQKYWWIIVIFLVMQVVAGGAKE